MAKQSLLSRLISGGDKVETKPDGTIVQTIYPGQTPKDGKSK